MGVGLRSQGRGASPEHGPQVPRAAPLDAQNASAFARKARSILQEKYLSARLEAAGTIFADIKQVSISEKLLQRVVAMLFALRRLVARQPAQLGEPRS